MAALACLVKVADDWMASMVCSGDDSGKIRTLAVRCVGGIGFNASVEVRHQLSKVRSIAATNDAITVNDPHQRRRFAGAGRLQSMVSRRNGAAESPAMIKAQSTTPHGITPQNRQ